MSETSLDYKLDRLVQRHAELEHILAGAPEISSARSTIWMARSTPAQKPRGPARTMVSGGMVMFKDIRSQPTTVKGAEQISILTTAIAVASRFDSNRFAA